MPDGQYTLGGQDVFLYGGVAKLADGTLAGSATNLYDCMTRAITFGVREEDAVRAATYNPACAIGAEKEVGTIEEGKAIGIEEGKSIGIEEGSLKKAVEIVDTLVSNMGFDLESALKAANITEEQYNEYKHK